MVEKERLSPVPRRGKLTDDDKNGSVEDRSHQSCGNKSPETAVAAQVTGP